MDLANFNPQGASYAEKRAAQGVLAGLYLYGGKLDGDWGPVSAAAFARWNALQKNGVHAVFCSTFADPADVKAFRHAKALGFSDQQAFRYGDNGIGCWGDDTTEGSGPSCALPPEDWKPLAHPRNALVEVTVNGKAVLAKLRDTMPAKQNITNGAGLDMNPDLCAVLGLKPGGMWRGTWRWA